MDVKKYLRAMERCIAYQEAQLAILERQIVANADILNRIREENRRLRGTQ